MRCSSFEPMLDPYVDGALSAIERGRLEAHVATCASCEELLAEIRVIDALLVTPAEAELPPNFSFRVMAEVRALPKPHVTRTPIVPVLLAYLAFSWIAIGTFLATGGTAARQAVSFVESSLGDASDVFAAVSTAVSQLCSHDTLGVGATMSAILLLDALATFAAVAAYGSLLGRFRSRGGNQS